MAKKAAPKAAAKAAPAEKAARPKPISKAEVLSELAEKAKLNKKQVSEVLEALTELVHKELGKKGPGLFVIPGLIRLKVVVKPATKAKEGFNPRTKEPMTIKAKPARKVVKAYPLKTLKESV